MTRRDDHGHLGHKKYVSFITSVFQQYEHDQFSTHDS